MILDKMMPRIYFLLKKVKYRKKINEFKEQLDKNKKFKGIHKNRRCFIIANGPSVKELDFSCFENEIVFTVNQLVRKPDFEKLRTNYHIWADRIFFEIDESNADDMEMLDVIKSVSRKSPKVEIFYEATAKPMVDKFGLENSSNVNYFQVLGLNPDRMEKMFVDFTQPIANYPTVVDYAILLAVYMGFKEIYLLGCDCTGIINIAQNKLKNAKDNLYAFEMTDSAAKRLERYSKQRNIKDELISQAIMFEKYEALDMYCKRNGAKLFNATEGGLLECIEHININNVLNNKEENVR
ncbi:MAG: DUF115 domain-containing protein [Lachnospiraceae bacterium]|nr:DUF115 domain-containing protein [Lachnospiraceae bacterium]